jgi:TolB protein
MTRQRRVDWRGRAALIVMTVLAGLGGRGASLGSATGVGQTPLPTQQPSEIELVISGDRGTPPRYAVPDFQPLTPEAAGMAGILGQVLWDDLNFEREFYLIPRDTYGTVPAARTADQIPFPSWRELGADAVVFGTVERSGNTVRVQVRLFNVRSRQSVFAKEYAGTAGNPRRFAHTIADEIHQQQRALRGVARTRLTFSSDRNRERLIGPVDDREVREIYVADYDGANPTRVTSSRQLNINPSWSPDARAIAYTRYRRTIPEILVSFIYTGVLETPTEGHGSNYLPAYSPDGTRIAFMSGRDGNPEIYVMNVNGSNVRRLTNHPANDATPTWSPTSAQIAFTSNRSGQPQIHVMNADGTGVRRLTTAESYADRATWSPTSSSEIAFYAQTGVGRYDIKILNLGTGLTSQITFGEGSNESPSFSPNGRHLAFTSTRAGGVQVFTIGRDGRGVRQVTREGNNYTPAWSN